VADADDDSSTVRVANLVPRLACIYIVQCDTIICAPLNNFLAMMCIPPYACPVLSCPVLSCPGVLVSCPTRVATCHLAAAYNSSSTNTERERERQIGTKHNYSNYRDNCWVSLLQY
jgi:hypothetical protein